MKTIQSACEIFLDNIRRANPKATYKNYKSDLLGQTGFISIVSPKSKIVDLTEEMGVQFIQSLLDRGLSASSRQRAASSLREFVRFAADEYNLPISVDRLNHKLKSRHLLKGVNNSIEYPAEKVQKVLDFARKMTPRTLEDHRDIAFIWTLAQTGLRVSEAIALLVGQIDRQWQAVIIGKGDKQATIHFGKIARSFISKYLSARETLDASTLRTREMLPLFARHDQMAGDKQVKPMSAKRAEAIIHKMSLLALGDAYDPTITCHKFRHYYITSVYHHNGDLKAAQELARHSSINTTNRYAHRNKHENARTSQEVFG